MPFLAAIPALISTVGGVVGAVAGAIPKGSSQDTTRNIGPAGALENQGNAASSQSLSELQGLVGQGPGANDVAAGSQSSRDLASMLQQYQNGGNIPGAQDISNANNFASKAFQSQRLGIQQNFQEAQQQYSQQAAIQGRNSLDPVFRNKQNIEMERQQAMLGAQQGQFANQFAMQQPEQRLNFAGQRATVLGGLASQAMSNRQALFNMGNQLSSREQNFRLGASGSSTTGSSGGGAGGAISGGIMGLGAGLSAANQLQNFNNPFKQPAPSGLRMAGGQ